MKTKTNFFELKDVFEKLLRPGGCPWDRRQTFESLLPYLREEVEEFVDAVKSQDDENMKEEIGDVLLHVMFVSQIAAKEGRFDIEDVLRTLIAKLKRRHPHVFGRKKFTDEKEVIAHWHRIKKREKRRAKGKET